MGVVAIPATCWIRSYVPRKDCDVIPLSPRDSRPEPHSTFVVVEDEDMALLNSLVLETIQAGIDQFSPQPSQSEPLFDTEMV